MNAAATRNANGMPHVLIMAGGTGGHVFPALAVAKALIERGARVSWLGTEAGIEARLVPANELELHTIDVAGLRGKGALSWFVAPLRLARACLQALGVVRKLAPQLVVGMGGFASGPGGLAARLSGRPLLIHEQNAAPGLTNRLLARIANTVLQAFPETFSGNKARSVGNPVRREILDLPAPAERFAGREGARHRLSDASGRASYERDGGHRSLVFLLHEAPKKRMWVRTRVLGGRLGDATLSASH